jgi:hypothetical protein
MSVISIYMIHLVSGWLRVKLSYGLYTNLESARYWMRDIRKMSEVIREGIDN